MLQRLYRILFAAPAVGRVVESRSAAPAAESGQQAAAPLLDRLQVQEQQVQRVQQAIAALDGKVDEMWRAMAERTEFMRHELMLEMRTLAGADAGDAGTARVEPRVVAQAKVEAMRRQGNLRLNIGCGHKPDPERVNVDMRELPGVDVVAAADRLPFAAGEVREVFSSHVLEHFPLEALRRRVLPAWMSLLAPGGELRAVVPDAQAMLQAHARGEMDFETLRMVTFGGQEYAGDFHHNMFTPDSLAQLFRQAGLGEVRVEAAGRRNGLCLEFQVVGTKA